jgi:hypothetical protein
MFAENNLCLGNRYRFDRSNLRIQNLEFSLFLTHQNKLGQVNGY